MATIAGAVTSSAQLRRASHERAPPRAIQPLSGLDRHGLVLEVFSPPFPTPPLLTPFRVTNGPRWIQLTLCEQGCPSHFLYPLPLESRSEACDRSARGPTDNEQAPPREGARPLPRLPLTRIPLPRPLKVTVVAEVVVCGGECSGHNRRVGWCVVLLNCVGPSGNHITGA